MEDQENNLPSHRSLLDILEQFCVILAHLHVKIHFLNFQAQGEIGEKIRRFSILSLSTSLSGVLGEY